MDGWIKLHRKFLEWEWFKVDEMVKLFIYLLLSANFEEKKWQGVTIKRGQLLTGINSLHEATKISHQTLKTCLSRLEKTGEINKQSTNKYTIITVCNYDSYQDNQTTTNNQTNQPLTNDQQTTNKQLTTTKELKELEEIKEINIIHYDEIINLFNSICISLSKVSKCTESRKIKIKSRFNEIGGIEKIKELFLMVQSSSFLKGENKENWKATFDWLFENDKNWVKVMEGNYNKTQQNNSSLRRIDKYEAFGMKRND